MNREIEYGPISNGIFIALVTVSPIVLMLNREYFLYYIFLLIFLGFGLRTFLIKTGLYRLWNSICDGAIRKWDEKHLQKRARKIDRGVELEQFRKSRYRDPKLPKNW